ncbi:uncharacterized mitochondrial protein AtMg00860-like [Nicotiana sylvestris]|uniref:uncharacterized mitochondrial protein AtMg00860-like n=1 Tax=Nicotiana sylvestris TaxID=4096 RepID=UPI00388CA0BB
MSVLQCLARAGYRLLSPLMFTQSKRWERLKAAASKPYGSHRLPLEFRLGRGKPLNPYLKAKMIDSLFRRELKPKEIGLFPDELVFDEDEHTGHLHIVLRVLQEGKLYAKFSKCEFWLNSVTFLGHIILGEGIRVDTQTIEAVKTWPRPTTLVEVRKFIGLASYYMRFVEGFSSLSAPLTKLTQKGAKFQWTDVCERSYQALKD